MATTQRLSNHLFLGGFLLLLVCAGGCSTIGGWAGRKIYPSLNIPIDGEPPPTFVNILPSAQLSAWIGGQGGGLNCSIPGFLKPAFFHTTRDGSDISLRFRQACAMHDLCYRHGSATYGYSQVDCDFALLDSSFRICSLIYLQKNAKIGVSEKKAAESLNEEDRSDATTMCRDQARKILLGVRLGGGGSFKAKDASSYFEFDPIPDRAVDYTIVRWLSVPADVSKRPQFVFLRTMYGVGRYETFPSSPAVVLASNFGFVRAPPYIVQGDAGDTLSSITRRTRLNSGIDLLYIERNQTKENISSAKRKDNGFDFDSSVLWINEKIPATLVFWKRTSSPDKRTLPYVAACSPAEGCTAWSSSIVKGTVQDSYRTLQSPPMRGHFFSAHCYNYVMFRRGGDPNGHEKRTDDRGEGFEERVGMLFGQDPLEAKSSACEGIPPRVLDIAEAYEPLGVIQMGDLDAFLGFSAIDSAKTELPFSARVFRLQDGPQQTEVELIDPRTKMPLSADWLRRSVSVTRKDLFPDGLPHITLTRVTTRPSNTFSSTRLEALDFPIDPKLCLEKSCSPPAKSGIDCDIIEDEEVRYRGMNFIRWSNAPAIAGIFPTSTTKHPTDRQQQLAFFKSGKDWRSLVLTLPPLATGNGNAPVEPFDTSLGEESRIVCRRISVG